MSSIEYVRRYYGVPAKIGGKVRCDGRLGTITGATQHLIVRPDSPADRPSPSTRWRCHPTWRMEFLDGDGNVIWPTA